jgi:hypothetical protein
MYQLPVHADNVNLLGKNINALKDTEALSDATKEGGLEVNDEKIMCSACSYLVKRTQKKSHFKHSQ